MNAKEMALKNLDGISGIFVKDLEALPESAFTQKFGPKTRTVADIVYEVNLVNAHLAASMRGEPQGAWPDGWVVAPAEFSDKQVIIDAFKSTMQGVIETVNSFSEESMFAPVQTENGETNVFERCRFMTIHMWYHSGQLNFIQTLVGDDGWHWN
jgi:hypothetical protein